jgi:hypothetical protein
MIETLLVMEFTKNCKNDNPNYGVCVVMFQKYTSIVATLLWKSVRMKLTFLKWRLKGPLGLLKLQSSIAGVKTPCIRVLFISLGSYWSVDVKNGLAWAIWTSAEHVMAKRKAGSQAGSLTPDH